MKKFILLIREDLRNMQNMTPEQLDADIAMMVKWVEGLTATGNFVQGDPLETGIKLATSNGVISDGPYIEAKEVISGFTIIKADSLAQAAELAMTCPGVQSGQLKMEVRPILAY